MKRHRITYVLGALSVCGVTLATCAKRSVAADQPDSENRFSNVGAIVWIEDPTHPVIIGSGVLIHPRVLLTAGHVTIGGEDALSQGIPVFEISRISFGTDAFDPSTWLEAVAIMTHPGFIRRTPAPDSGSHDLGVVILKDPVDLPCATLGYEGLLDDLRNAGLLVNQGQHERLLAVGYGATRSFPPPGFMLGDGPRRFCFPEYRALEHENWIIANQNDAAGNTGVAAGDSGGPLFWRAANGELIVVALNSRSDAGGFVSLYRGYRVDTTAAQDFIDLVLESGDAGLFN